VKKALLSLIVFMFLMGIVPNAKAHYRHDYYPYEHYHGGMRDVWVPVVAGGLVGGCVALMMSTRR
jgi:hypothetical protein